MDNHNEMNFSTPCFEDLVSCELHPYDSFYDLKSIQPVENDYLNTVTTAFQPFLEVLIQPVERFRFRYPTESAHGSLGGTQKKTYPTVKLHNFNESNVFVRCSLWCHEDDQPHPFNLKLISKKKPKTDMIINCPLNERNEAAFPNMSVMCILKSKYTEEIKKKVEALLEEDGIVCEENTLNERVRLIERTFDPNKVRLRFDAFIATTDGKRTYLCKEFSNVIFNSKCTKTSELRIERLNICSGTVNGGDEMFLCVDKVDKKNIKVRFFELDEEENEIWYAFAKIVEVHHQYTIIIKTPQYRNVCTETFVDVFVELFRPSDNTRSERRGYKYLPATKKRKAGDFLDANEIAVENVDCVEENYEAYVQLLKDQSTSNSEDPL